ncbi:hypothetical protein EGW08_005853 [Elysia chlorotica]|uniref:tRNA(Phe) (4-demethylwyosine(37)-C(7)) aminocarboxypropyltransferase n=1 Tax=Elysia chlorotica TaxID=188477 RepID=A0A3S1HUK3_ELYCH|nr:hypothetical protein EGW08_005853 [Elysia chlorotica]
MTNERENPINALSLIVQLKQGKEIRQQLEKRGLFDDCHRLVLLGEDQVAIPIRQDMESLEFINRLWPDFIQRRLNMPLSKKAQARLNTPSAKLSSELSRLMNQYNISEDLKTEIPRKWEKHHDLVIIPATSFISEDWTKIPGLWKVVAKCLSCQRLARHACVASDGIRSSQITMLLGNSGQVTHLDNGISYSYDITKCMFSAGNITEKLRIASWDCSREIVVDLYAGIGYFTLPYLVHAKAAHVHACEWNPHAAAALRQNLKDNGVSDRCSVHEGDCRQLDLPPVADRVNLGLIPSSEDGWPTAVRVLRHGGGMLHIHSNVEHSLSTGDRDECSGGSYGGDENGVSSSVLDCTIKLSGKEKLQQACTLWSSYTQSRILSLLHTIKGSNQWSVRPVHLEVVKSYAPHIVHVVLDLECRISD